MRARAVTLLAYAFVAIGLFAIGLAYFADSYDGWASNIAVEAFSLAATIAVVERILARSERRARQPRLQRIEEDIERHLG